MRYEFVVDDDGDVWPDGDPALSAYLRTYRSGADLQTFLISRLGFIGMTSTGRRMDVAFDHDKVSPKAIGGAIYWLRERDFVPTRVFDPANPDIVSLFATRGNLIAHLSDHMMQRQSMASVSRMPIPLEQSAFATRWRAALGICEEVERPSPRHRLLGDLFQGYFSILSRAEGGDCTIEHLGDAYASWDPEFHQNGAGRTFRDVFDKKAGTLLAEGYRQIAGARLEPSAESVRALMSFPDQPVRRINHDRLILPIGASQILIANFVH
jgi:hypothetical protein